jgi:hypothetical protein
MLANFFGYPHLKIKKKHSAYGIYVEQRENVMKRILKKISLICDKWLI